MSLLYSIITPRHRITNVHLISLNHISSEKTSRKSCSNMNQFPLHASHTQPTCSSRVSFTSITWWLDESTAEWGLTNRLLNEGNHQLFPHNLVLWICINCEIGSVERNSHCGSAEQGVGCGGGENKINVLCPSMTHESKDPLVQHLYIHQNNAPSSQTWRVHFHQKKSCLWFTELIPRTGQEKRR
jgi:hypothetical protein